MRVMQNVFFLYVQGYIVLLVMADAERVTKLKNLTPADIEETVESFFTPEAIQNMNSMGANVDQMRALFLTMGHAIPTMEAGHLQQMIHHMDALKKDYTQEEGSATATTAPAPEGEFTDYVDLLREALPDDTVQNLNGIYPTLMKPDSERHDGAAADQNHD